MSVPTVGGRALDRVGLLIAAGVFFVVYLTTYATLTAPMFDYFGLGFRPTLPLQYWLLIAVLSLLPAFWMPTSIDRPATFLLYVVYLVVYIPALIVAYHGNLPGLTDERATQLCLMLFIGFSIMSVGQRILPVVELPGPGISQSVVMALWLSFGLVCFGYVVYLLGGTAQIVSLDAVNTLRAMAAEEVEMSGSVFGLYALSWVNSFVLPVWFAIGVLSHRRWICLIVIAAYLFLFAAWGGKASLICPIVLIGLTLLLKFPPRFFPVVMMMTFSALLLLPLAVPANIDLSDFLSGWIVALIHQRTFSSSALLISQYLAFFDLFPQTSGSHITGLGTFLWYPYDAGIPQTIGYYYYGGPMTANVNFWAQDGIAGFGLAGIPIVSVICALVFWLIDSCSRHLRPDFVVLSFAYIGTNFADTGLFTTLLTGGVLLLAVVLWFMRLPYLRR